MTGRGQKGVYIFPTIYNSFSMTDFTTAILRNNKGAAFSEPAHGRVRAHAGSDDAQENAQVSGESATEAITGASRLSWIYTARAATRPELFEYLPREL